MKNLSFIFILATLSMAGLRAQESPLVLDKQGLFEILERSDYNNEKCGFSETEISENLKRIAELVALVRINPVLANPTGFQGRARIYDVHCDDPGSYGIPSRVSFEFCSYFRNRNGEVVNNTIEPPEWSVLLNKQNPTGYGFYSILADKKHGIFTIPFKKETLAPGVDLYDDACYVFYDPDRPPYWLPVTVDEAFEAVRDFWNRETDKDAAQQMLMFVEMEYDQIPVALRSGPAFYGGNISRVSASPDYEGEKNLFPPLMKVNPDYWNRSLPRSVVQFMYCKIEGNQAYRSLKTEEALQHNSSSYHEYRFLESVDLKLLISLQTLIGR